MSRRACVIVILLATLTVYGRVCGYGFTNAEDEGLITRNPNLNPPTLAGLWNHWRHPHIGLYIPVTYTAWWALANLGQTSVPDETGSLLNSWLFHSFNVALHACNAILVFGILRRLRLRAVPSLIGALLFALHPLQIEAVSWTTGTKDVLSGFFALAALHQHLSAIESRSRARHVIATLLFVLALLAKPSTIVLPLIAAIIDRAILGLSWRDVAKVTSPWLVLVLPMLLITKLVQPAAEVPDQSLWLRPLVAGDALAFYLAKLAWPFDLTMAYGRSPAAILRSGAIYWMFLVPLAIAAALFVARKRVPMLLAAALIFAAGVLPVLGLTKFTFQQFSTVADRFIYLSMLGVALAAAYVVSSAPRRAASIVATIVLALLAVRSFDQAGTWRGRETLYRHAVAVAPDSPVARNNLGSTLFNRGDARDAEPQFRRAVELEPQNPGVRKNLARALDAQGRYPELIEQLEILMRLQPSREMQAWLDSARKAAAAANEHPRSTTTAPAAAPTSAPSPPARATPRS